MKRGPSATPTRRPALSRAVVLLCLAGALTAAPASAQTVSGGTAAVTGSTSSEGGELRIAAGEAVSLRTSSGGTVLHAGLLAVVLSGSYVSVEPAPSLPFQFAVDEPYPNPFNPSTTITLHLPAAAPVRVEVVNLLGRRVALLLDAPLPPGHHRVLFDGSRLASGVYFVHTGIPGRLREIRRVVLLK
jgi:hypothetical protein